MSKNTELKCIKELCKCYFESDKYFEVCQLVSKYCIADKCIGLNAIKPKMEEIICQVSKLLGEYNELAQLESWIKNNQEKESR